MRLAGGWHPSASAEERLFDAACELLGRARELERTSAVPGAGHAIPAVIGALSTTFEACANSVLAIRASAIAELRPGEEEDHRSQLAALARLLFAIDQNLRFAAEASGRAQELAASLDGERDEGEREALAPERE